MARINLTTRGAFGVRYQHPNERPGTTTLIRTYHVYISLFVAPRGSGENWRPRGNVGHDRRFEAVVDTGAPITILPFGFWQQFAADVDILAQPSADSQLQIGGSSRNGQLGRLRLGAVDADGHWMPADWTVAIFLDEPSATGDLRTPLLGLNSHLMLHNRRLRHTRFSEGDDHATVPEWCLEDKPRLLPW